MMLHSHRFILAALRYAAVTMGMNKTAAELRDHSAAVFLFFELSNIYSSAFWSKKVDSKSASR